MQHFFQVDIGHCYSHNRRLNDYTQRCTKAPSWISIFWAPKVAYCCTPWKKTAAPLDKFLKTPLINVYLEAKLFIRTGISFSPSSLSVFS